MTTNNAFSSLKIFFNDGHERMMQTDKSHDNPLLTISQYNKHWRMSLRLKK
jgi:hypothetical protein